MTAPCGCPQYPGRRITDADRHAEFHALVVAQGGPAGEVRTRLLAEKRGHR